MKFVFEYEPSPALSDELSSAIHAVMGILRDDDILERGVTDEQRMCDAEQELRSVAGTVIFSTSDVSKDDVSLCNDCATNYEELRIATGDGMATLALHENSDKQIDLKKPAAFLKRHKVKIESRTKLLQWNN